MAARWGLGAEVGLALLGERGRDERMLQHATPSFVERDALWSK
jgi:hypothetical protein